MFSNDLKKLIDKYAQIPVSMDEEKELEQKSLMPEVIEPKQLALPGIEPGYDRPLSKQERLKTIEVRDREERNRRHDDTTWDTEEGTIPLAKSNPTEFSSYDPWEELPVGLNKREYEVWKHYNRREIEMEDRRLPSPNIFPEMNESQLMTVFYTNEWLDKFLRDKRVELESKGNDERKINHYINNLRNDYETKYYILPISVVKQNYDRFREVYANWYYIYVRSQEDLEGIPNPFIYLKNMQEKSILEVFSEVVDIVNAGIRYAGANEIMKMPITNDIWDMSRPMIINHPYLNANMLNTSSMEIAIKQWEAREKILAEISDKLRNKISLFLDDSNNVKMLKYLDRHDAKIKNKLFRKISRMVGLIQGRDLSFDTVYENLNQWLNDVEGLAEILWINFHNEIRRNVEVSDVSKNRLDKFRSLSATMIGEIIHPMVELARDVINKNKVSDEDWFHLVSLLDPYFKISKLEKMFTLGLFGENIDINLFRLHFMKVISEDSFWREMTTMYINISDTMMFDEDLEESDMRAMLQPQVNEMLLRRIPDLLLSSHKLNKNLGDDFNFRGVRKLAMEGEGFGGQDLINKIINSSPTFQSQVKVVKKFLNKSIMEIGYNFVYEISLYENNNISLILSVKTLERLGKVDINLLNKLYDLFRNMKFNHIKLKDVNQYLPDSCGSNEDVADIFASSIRSINSALRDIHGAYDIIRMFHNNTKSIDKEVIKGLVGTKNVPLLRVQKKEPNNYYVRQRENLGLSIDPEVLEKELKPNEWIWTWEEGSNIVRKLYMLVTKILGQGGVVQLMNDKKNIVKMLEERDILKSGLETRLNKVVEIVKRNEEVHPKKPGFEETKALIIQVSSDIDLVLEYEKMEEFYNEAVKEENRKVPELFRLNMNLSSNIRFRVLPDLDIKYFQVGNETQCCQSPGGEGEAAMVDSFINPRAGVLVLENLDGGVWETVSQSYFHYVPPDQREGERGEFTYGIINDVMDVDDDSIDLGGYILDNVEVNNKYQDGLRGVYIEEYYAYWALSKKKELGIGYIQAGSRYSGIRTSMFTSTILDSDPRDFVVSDPYTDWNVDQVNLDLTKPDFKLKAFEDPRNQKDIYDKVSALSFQFIRLILG